MGDVAVLDLPAEPDLTGLARRRLAAVLDADAATASTLDAVLARLFDRDHRELLTYSAFGSAL